MTSDLIVNELANYDVSVGYQDNYVNHNYVHYYVWITTIVLELLNELFFFESNVLIFYYFATPFFYFALFSS